MEDSLSDNSNESVATSEEFDFVGEKPGVSRTPTLDFKNGDLKELTNALTEVLQEPGVSMSDLLENSENNYGQKFLYGSLVELGKDPLGEEVNTLTETKKQNPVKLDASSEEESHSEYFFVIYFL